MFSDLKDITISGGCYRRNTVLEGVLAHPINIIYGQNGSGKSSLAKAFYEYASGAPERSFDLKLGRMLSDEERERIKVFDEDYVNRNVLVEGDELEAIVMLGDQITTAEKKQKLMERSMSLLDQKEKLESELENAKNGWSSASDRIEKQLKNDGKCKDRLMTLRGLKRKPTVSIDQVYDARLNVLQFSDDIVVLTNEVNEEMKRLLNGMGGTEIKWYRHQTLSNVEVVAIRALLDKKLKRPELSDEDQDLLRIATEQFHYIEEARSQLIAKGATRCPLCQQPLTNDYLAELSDRIKMVLNEEADELKAALSRHGARLVALADDVPDFPNDGYAEDVMLYKSAVARLNSLMEGLKRAIEQKIGNLYGEVKPFDFNALNDALTLADTYARTLESDVERHNDVVNDIKRLKEELEQKVMWLAYLENETDLEQRNNLGNKIAKLEGDLSDVEAECQVLKSEIDELVAEANNIRIALNYINQCIAFVFADPNRLKLEPTNNGKYRLLSRGTVVPPHKVSVGERNIIALSYYFAKLNEGADMSSSNGQPVLMVIDDPVSSFDAGNKVGILSLLKWQIEEYFNNMGAGDCKVLLMSHDLLTIHDFEAIYSELSVLWTYGKKDVANVYELHRKAYRDGRVYSEYSTMLRNIYFLAIADNPDSGRYVGMGNTMRRVLESFAKIMYNRAYTTALTERFFLKGIYCIERLGETEEMYKKRVDRKAQYYDNLALRELFNAESHATATVDFDSFESHFAGAELQKYARMVLLMLLYSNSQHLKSYLDERMFETVCSWVDVVDGL